MATTPKIEFKKYWEECDSANEALETKIKSDPKLKITGKEDKVALEFCKNLKELCTRAQKLVDVKKSYEFHVPYQHFQTQRNQFFTQKTLIPTSNATLQFIEFYQLNLLRFQEVYSDNKVLDGYLQAQKQVCADLASQVKLATEAYRKEHEKEADLPPRPTAEMEPNSPTKVAEKEVQQTASTGFGGFISSALTSAVTSAVNAVSYMKPASSTSARPPKRDLHVLIDLKGVDDSETVAKLTKLIAPSWKALDADNAVKPSTSTTPGWPFLVHQLMRSRLKSRFQIDIPPFDHFVEIDPKSNALNAMTVSNAENSATVAGIGNAGARSQTPTLPPTSPETPVKKGESKTDKSDSPSKVMIDSQPGTPDPNGRRKSGTVQSSKRIDKDRSRYETFRDAALDCSRQLTLKKEDIQKAERQIENERNRDKDETHKTTEQIRQLQQDLIDQYELLTQSCFTPEQGMLALQQERISIWSTRETDLKTARDEAEDTAAKKKAAEQKFKGEFQKKDTGFSSAFDAVKKSAKTQQDKISLLKTELQKAKAIEKKQVKDWGSIEREFLTKGEKISKNLTFLEEVTTFFDLFFAHEELCMKLELQSFRNVKAREPYCQTVFSLHQQMGKMQDLFKDDQELVQVFGMAIEAIEKADIEIQALFDSIDYFRQLTPVPTPGQPKTLFRQAIGNSSNNLAQLGQTNDPQKGEKGEVKRGSDAQQKLELKSDVLKTAEMAKNAGASSQNKTGSPEKGDKAADKGDKLDKADKSDKGEKSKAGVTSRADAGKASTETQKASTGTAKTESSAVITKPGTKQEPKVLDKVDEDEDGVLVYKSTEGRTTLQDALEKAFGAERTNDSVIATRPNNTGKPPLTPAATMALAAQDSLSVSAGRQLASQQSASKQKSANNSGNPSRVA